MWDGGRVVGGYFLIFLMFLFSMSTCSRRRHRCADVVSNEIVSARGRIMSFTAICLGKAGCNDCAGRGKVCRLGAIRNRCVLIISTMNCRAMRGGIGLTGKREVRIGIAVTPGIGRLKRIMMAASKINQMGGSTFGTMTISTGGLRGDARALTNTLAGIPKMGLHRSNKMKSSVRLCVSNFDKQRIGVFVSKVPRRKTNTTFSLGGIPVGCTSHVRICGNIIPMKFNASTVKKIIGVIAGGRPKG